MDATEWDKRYQTADLVWGAEPNQFVRRLCERLPIGDALDLACGEGRNALWLARVGWRVVGVDFSRTAVERAQQLTSREPETVRARTRWRVADVRTDVPEPLSADLVVVSYVHLHPAETASMLRAASAAVRPDGHLVVVGHDKRNLAEGVGGPQDGSLLYAPTEIAAAALAGGLEVDVAETVQREAGDGTALDTIVRARRPSTADVA